MKYFPTIFLLVALLTSAKCLEDFETGGERLDSFEEGNREPLSNTQPNLDYIEGEFPTHKPSSPAVIHTSAFGDDTSDIFEHTFGGFLNPFNPFGNIGGFNFNNFNTYKPWYKGANICTTREESVEEDEKNQENGQEPTSFMHHFSMNIESCSETPSKHICKRITNQGGRKKTVILTSSCCHGFRRSRSTGFCENFELKTMAQIAEKLNAKLFMNAAVKNDLNDMMTNSNITIFMPNDDKFMEISSNAVDNDLSVAPLRSRRQGLEGGLKTRDVVLNHIVEGFIDIEDVDNEQMFTSQFENYTIRMNVYPKIFFKIGGEIADDDENDNGRYLYTANCMPVKKSNIFAKNGIVHKIDGVLTPITQNVMEIIRSRDDMTILKTVLEKTKMDQLLDGMTEDGAKQFTIFAPTDSAFEKLDPQLKRKLKEGSSCAENILKNHILDLTFCSAAVMDPEARVSAFNILGQKMIFEKSSNESSTDEKITNEIKATLDIDDTILINEKAKILERDLMGTNGVVHIIDTLLETPSALPISTMMGTKNLTIFKKLMEYGSYADDFDNLENATYFIPTDEAFESSETGKFWIKQLEEAPAKLKNNENLKKFLDYHVVQPMTKSTDLTEKLLPTIGGEALRVNLYSTLPGFTNVMNLGTVNCARLIHFDQDSCGSVLHQVDKVLNAPNETLLQMLENNPNYSQFLKLVRQANLTSILEEFEGKGYTLFVPRDEVFAEVDEWVKKKSADELKDLIKNHIASDVTCCAGIIRSDWPFTYTIKTISQNPLTLNRDRRPRVQNAGVSKCDIIGTNGIIHEINDVINIPQRRPISNNNGGFYGSFFNKPFFFRK